MLRAINRNLQILSFSLSVAGVLVNSVAILVLTYVPNRSQKFVQYLQIYSLSCLVVNLDCGCLAYSKIFFSDAANNFSNYYMACFVVYVCLPLYVFCHTFVMILNTLIAYERIQMFKMNFVLLRTTPAWALSLLALLFAVVVGMPTILAQTLEPVASGTTYSLVTSELFTSPRFQMTLMLGIFVKHVLVFSVELLVNGYLIVCMRHFYRNRPRGQARGLSSTECKNDSIILVMCSLSIVQQVFSLLRIHSSLAIEEQACSEMLTLLSVLVILSFNFKHALNFFILALLNSHFRKCALTLLPTWQFGDGFGQQTPSPVEHVHLETVRTRM